MARRKPPKTLIGQFIDEHLGPRKLKELLTALSSYNVTISLRTINAWRSGEYWPNEDHLSVLSKILNKDVTELSASCIFINPTGIAQNISTSSLIPDFLNPAPSGTSTLSRFLDFRGSMLGTDVALKGTWKLYHSQALEEKTYVNRGNLVVFSLENVLACLLIEPKDIWIGRVFIEDPAIFFIFRNQNRDRRWIIAQKPSLSTYDLLTGHVLTLDTTDHYSLGAGMRAQVGFFFARKTDTSTFPDSTVDYLRMLMEDPLSLNDYEEITKLRETCGTFTSLSIFLSEEPEVSYLLDRINHSQRCVKLPLGNEEDNDAAAFYNQHLFAVLSVFWSR